VLFAQWQSILALKDKTLHGNFGDYLKPYFDEIKEKLFFTHVAAFYGIRPGRGGMARCPFHKNGKERTPSAKIYVDHMYCFTCGKSWDAVSLVQDMYRLSAFDAAKKISDDFHLGLFDREISPVERHRIAKAAEKRKCDTDLISSFEAWLHEKTLQYAAMIRVLHKMKKENRPTANSPDFSDEFVVACHMLDHMEYIYRTVFIEGDFEVQMEYFASGAVL